MRINSEEATSSSESQVRRKPQEIRATICGVVAVDFGRYLNGRGLDGASVLKAAGLKSETLNDRYSRVPIQQVAAAFELSARYENDPVIGLHFGEWYSPPVLNASNYAISSAPDLRSALNILHDHRNMVAGIPTQMSDHGAYTEFSWIIELASLSARHVIDYNAMRTLKNIHKATGVDWKPIRVNLAYEKPDKVCEYYRLLGPNIHFNQPANGFWIDSAAMAKPMPDANPDIFHMAQNSIRNPFACKRDDTNPIDRLRRYISERLGKDGVTLDAASKHMGMTQQQLRRLLKKHDSCFQCVLDDTRKAHAAHYLCETETCFSDVAFLLGFSDQSAFSRAVKRWFGIPPKDMRRKFNKSTMLAAAIR